VVGFSKELTGVKKHPSLRGMMATSSGITLENLSAEIHFENLTGHLGIQRVDGYSTNGFIWTIISPESSQEK
jgi:hypothetical protein